MPEKDTKESEKMDAFVAHKKDVEVTGLLKILIACYIDFEPGKRP